MLRASSGHPDAPLCPLPRIFNKPCFPNGRVVVRQAVAADLVFAREETGVAFEVLYEAAQREALLGAVLH